ncbi:hypothetical protein COOONC_22329 [Cooperia oncophora]
MDLERQLRAARQELQDLKQALPPLPSAIELHDEIVQHCLDFHDCTQSVRTLENRVKQLRISREPLISRIHEAEYLELKSDHFLLRLLSLVTQLRTLFDLSAILLATKRATDEEWSALMNAPHKTSTDEPLVVKLSTIEDITNDQFHNIVKIQAAVRDLRRSYKYEERQDRISFEEEVLNRLARMERIIVESRDQILQRLGLQQEPHPTEGQVSVSMQYQQPNEKVVHVKPEEEDAQSKLLNPSNEEMDADGEQGKELPELVEDEEYDSDSNHENRHTSPEDDEHGSEYDPEDRGEESENGMKESPGDRDEGDESGTDDDSENDAKERERGQVAHPEDDLEEGEHEEEPDTDIKPNMRNKSSDDQGRRITAEIRKEEQALRRFDEIIRQLKEEPLCPPRRYISGVPREIAAKVRCAFCGVVAHHYSDACARVRSVKERRDLVITYARCEYCLERHCTKDRACKKYDLKCYHCRRRGHHSALCELPERSEKIRRRIEEANKRQEYCHDRTSAPASRTDLESDVTPPLSDLPHLTSCCLLLPFLALILFMTLLALL